MASPTPARSLSSAARLLLTRAVVLCVRERNVLKEKWKMLVHGPFLAGRCEEGEGRASCDCRAGWGQRSGAGSVAKTVVKRCTEHRQKKTNVP